MNTLKMMKQSLAHPLDFFYDIQFENRARLRDAVMIILLAICARLFFLMSAGYSYQPLEPYMVSFLFETLWTVLPWLTWSVANWGVSAILDGEGKFKDILVSSAYVYVPYILILFPLTIVSNVLTLKEAAVYMAINGFMLCWMLFLLLVHVKVLHDFDLGKAVWVTLLSIFGMLLIWFLCLMIFGLVNQSATFVVDLFKEIRYRS